MGRPQPPRAMGRSARAHERWLEVSLHVAFLRYASGGDVYFRTLTNRQRSNPRALQQADPPALLAAAPPCGGARDRLLPTIQKGTDLELPPQYVQGGNWTDTGDLAASWPPRACTLATPPVTSGSVGGRQVLVLCCGELCFRHGWWRRRAMCPSAPIRALKALIPRSQVWRGWHGGEGAYARDQPHRPTSCLCLARARGGDDMAEMRALSLAHVGALLQHSRPSPPL